MERKRDDSEDESKMDGSASSLIAEDYLQAVFGNGLLFNKIAGYLGTADLKVLRQTSKLFFARVNSYKRFSDNLCITLTNETIQENANTGAIKWKSARIVLDSISAENMEVFKNHLNHVTDLKINHRETNSDLHTRTICYGLFLHASNLKSLTLDVNLLCYNIPKQAMDCIVGTVDHLYLYGHVMTPMKFPTEAFIEAYTQNINMLATLAWKLKCLVIGKGASVELPNGMNMSGFSGLQRIIASNASSLEVFKSDVVGLRRLGETDGLVLPCLKSIDLLSECSTIEENKLLNFVNNQPRLQHIKVNTPPASFIPLRVLEVVKSKCGPLLHTLELGAVELVEPISNFWDFLKNQATLRRFKVRGKGVESPRNIVPQILDCLPSTINYLNIGKMISSQRGGWDLLTANALSRFSDLNDFTIIDCPNVLTDVLMQWICSNLTRLRKLHFGYSHNITDFGLTGQRVDETGYFNSGVSLKNLTGLQELEIIHCSRITVQGALKVIAFKELQVLELKCHHVMSDIELMGIASRNPSLEYLGRRISTEDVILPRDKGLLFSFVLSANPRLTKIYSSTHSKRCDKDWIKPSELCHRPSYGVMSSKFRSAQAEILRWGTVARVEQSKVYLQDKIYLEPSIPS